MNVLILMSNTGGGHRSVSLAVQRALYDLDPDGVSSEIVDVFDLENPRLFDRVTRLYGPVSRYLPNLYGWAFHMMDRPALYRTVFDTSTKPLVPKLVRLLADRRPDVVVTTHPLCNRALVQARDQLDPRLPVVATVTELVTVHRSWVEAGIDQYTVATDEAHEAVLGFGAPPERITQTGLPILGAFGTIETPPAQLRRQWGLDPERFTALLVGGGEGSGGLDKLIETIGTSSIDVQLMVVCGRNEQLKAKLDAGDWGVPMRVHGFVDNMSELMHAADVVMTKGGPQSITEGLASGRSLVITQTLPGQEEGNAEFVERHEVGFDGRERARAVASLRYLAEHPDERQRMSERARSMAQPDAARKIARVCLDAGSRVAANA